MITRAPLTMAAVLVFGLTMLSAACRAPEGKAPEPSVIWRPLGSWSGHGNTQTESFTSDSGSLRVQWSTANAANGRAGTFRLTIHSAISGRPLMEAVNHNGPGSGTAFVPEDPRVFFAVVESVDLDWSFSLQEAVLVEPKRP